ncbi:MAG: tetratricopeptide repeat protein [Tannerella sp.]|jgi:tetratricopeptide (TPR) repeat protein|nr:tetratricopeptide repeat protein [Tannerella sp.]
MKSKIFLLAAVFLITAGVNAQKGVDSGTPYGSGEDSIRCLTNISLFIPYAKSNNFKDAYPFWKIVYDECPASTKNIYVYGVNIISWQISQETDATRKDALINDLMKLYDDRIKYFGDDKQYGKDWIVSRKAQTYNQLKGDNTDPGVIYKWTGDVLDEFKDKTEPLAISLYMFASFKLMQNDTDKYKSQYVNDFLKCSDILDAQYAAAEAANNEKDAENILTRKTEIEQNFAASSVADCETLQSIYASKIEENKDNLDFLKETMTLLRRVGCKESDAYIAAAEYSYQMEPTAESAMGLGTKAFKDKDYATAEKYYNEAISMSDNSDIKADLYYALGAMASQQGQHVKSKQYSQKCLAEKPGYGRAYILIAQAYAAGGKGVFPDDPVLMKCVYYAVVDKLERARHVDSSVADEAARLIATYSKYFPTKEEVFMHPSLNAGENFAIGSWIGETVRIR